MVLLQRLVGGLPAGIVADLTTLAVGAHRADILGRLRLRSNRFGFEPEFTAKIARLGCRVYEVSISYHGRGYDAGKKITWKDGITAIGCIIWYRFFD